MSNRAPWFALSVAVALVAMSGHSFASPQADKGHGPGSGQAWEPPGNNGTIKVDGEPFDTSRGNEPHPGCVFRINFFNYDGDSVHATYEFDLHPPSGSGVLLSGAIDFTGGKGYDASTGSIDLSSELTTAGATANPNQGYHVSLTVHASGSIGSDVKHKLFWVSDCSGAQQPATSTSGSGAGAGSPGTGAAATPQTSAPAGRSAAARPGHSAAARPARAVSGSPAFTG